MKKIPEFVLIVIQHYQRVSQQSSILQILILIIIVFEKRYVFLFYNNTNINISPKTNSDWNAWYATFDTYWLKSNHTEFYEEEKKRLLQIQKSTAEKEQQTRKTSLSSNSSSINPKSDENHNKNKYQRQQKSRYANSHQQTSSPTVVKKNAHMLALKNRIAIVENGILWINVMEAVGIPDCDTFSLPDCYCKYYITSNDPCFNHKYYTKVKDNTVNLYIFCIFLYIIVHYCNI